MKFKVEQRKYDEETMKDEVVATHNFLRTINTEKMFREEIGEEMNAQIGEVLFLMSSVENDPTPENIAKLTDLQFSETRHELLKFMYAERNESGVLVQGEKTREHFEALEDFSDKDALSEFFRRL